MKHTLYPWQEKCLKSWQKNRCHGIIHVATGSGKTYFALAAAELLLDRHGRDSLRVRIVVPTSALLTQWTAAILNYFPDTVTRQDIGLCCGSRKDTPDHLFMIYVINSARYSIARHIVNDIKNGLNVFVIADECHRYVGNENRRIFDYLPTAAAHPEQYASIGLSATPGLEYEENASVLIPALGPEIFHYGLKEAEEDATLCPYTAFHIALSFTAEERAEYEDLSDRLSKVFRTLITKCPELKGSSSSRFFHTLYQIAGGGKYASLARQYMNLSYQRKHLTSDASSRIQCVLKIISQLDQNAKIIVFGERIDQADLLYKSLESLCPGQTARFHSGIHIQARKLALERFQDGEVRILIACRALDEGFDVPSANVGIVMSSASVNRQRIQRLGRILRKYEGKQTACLYYLYIADSSEESTYFPVDSQATVCELSYRMEQDTLYHPAYTKRAQAAMRTFQQKNPDERLIAEARECFRRGVIRPDWLMGEVYCEERKKRAKTTKERNYWICMKTMNRQNKA